MRPILAAVLAHLLLCPRRPRPRAATAGGSFLPAAPRISTPEEIRTSRRRALPQRRAHGGGAGAVLRRWARAQASVSVREAARRSRNVSSAKRGRPARWSSRGALRHRGGGLRGGGHGRGWSLWRTLRTLRDVRRGTILFVASGGGGGAGGSRAMVDAIGKEELARYCAMVNLDSFGPPTRRRSTTLRAKSSSPSPPTWRSSCRCLSSTRASTTPTRTPAPFLRKKNSGGDAPRAVGRSPSSQSTPQRQARSGEHGRRLPRLPARPLSSSPSSTSPPAQAFR